VPLMDVPGGHAPIRDAALRRFDEVAARGAFTLGPELEAFEEEWAAYCGVSHAVGVGTGTSALHLALVALGAGPGTEVVTVPMTFVATVEAIVEAGATPVFADVDPDTRSLSPAALEAALTPRTAAVVPVHLYGRPAPMPALAEICARAGVALV
jgi:dTDP-4-amino-4,6-dideoxygalactose transaminase